MIFISTPLLAAVVKAVRMDELGIKYGVVIRILLCAELMAQNMASIILAQSLSGPLAAICTATGFWVADFCLGSRISSISILSLAAKFQLRTKEDWRAPTAPPLIRKWVSLQYLSLSKVLSYF